ncbi:MAG TPA: NADPH-dependent FMN reductase [Actinocrinis sp.]|nr:NADPH-dependent FMN reductase [Actinocrinis sp.]
MTTILALSGSPSSASRTVAAVRGALDLLAERGYQVRHVAVRELPAAELLAADTGHPQIQKVLAEVAEADGVIVATPIYKASYTGVIKALLDLLPQTGLRGKAVLPLATGGTLAHLLAVDYALRPVLSALGARHVVPGTFLLDSAFVSGPAEPGHPPVRYSLAPDAELRLTDAIAEFVAALPGPSLDDEVAALTNRSDRP